jgi:uncharacterized protein (DUF1697 family)
MARSVALLRAVNVGGRSVPMSELRGLFEQLGGHRVATYIQSGNVIFDPPRVAISSFEDDAEQALFERYGLRSAVTVRSADEIQDVLTGIPFPTGVHRFVHVGFFKSAPAPDEVDDLSSYDAGEERLAVAARVCYLYLPNGVGRAKLPAKVNRLSTPVTVRNLRTVTALARLATEGPPQPT